MKKILLTSCVLLSVGFGASAQKSPTLVQSIAEKNSINTESLKKEASKIESEKKGNMQKTTGIIYLSKKEALLRAKAKN